MKPGDDSIEDQSSEIIDTFMSAKKGDHVTIVPFVVDVHLGGCFEEHISAFRPVKPLSKHVQVTFIWRAEAHELPLLNDSMVYSVRPGFFQVPQMGHEN